MDDHQFWKQADRKKLLEQMKNLWNNSYGTGGFGLYGSDGRGASPGSLQEEISLQEKHRYDFHRFLRHFAVHREELHTDTEVLTIFLISMVWNIMAICHSLNIWNTRK